MLAHIILIKKIGTFEEAPIEFFKRGNYIFGAPTKLQVAFFAIYSISQTAPIEKGVADVFFFSVKKRFY